MNKLVMMPASDLISGSRSTASCNVIISKSAASSDESAAGGGGGSSASSSTDDHEINNNKIVVNRLKTNNSAAAAGLTNWTLAGASNLLKLLPAGTVVVFQLLVPLLTNNGECSSSSVYQYLTVGVLLVICAAASAFSCFTDSYTGSDGNTYYGIATMKGMYIFGLDGVRPPPPPSVDIKAYRLRVGDFVHAIFSLLVFAAVALLNPDVSTCYYPPPLATTSTYKLKGQPRAAAILGTLAMALPPAVGALATTVFAVFPNERHGIGYAAN